MDHYSILRRASDHHARLLEETARGHLVASGAAKDHAGNRRGMGYRLGAVLVQLGSRLQGIGPKQAEPATMPGVATGASEGR